MKKAISHNLQVHASYNVHDKRLLDILESNLLRSLLLQFLETRFCGENLLFWSAAEDFSTLDLDVITPVQLKEKAEEIYNLYIAGKICLTGISLYIHSTPAVGYHEEDRIIFSHHLLQQRFNRKHF